MKKTGYQGEFAGAVEAASSTGGQIMPPVMGATAFLIAEYLGIPYFDLVKAALIPAVLLLSPLLRSLSPSRSLLTARERESALLTSPPFLISVILYILLTCANVQLVS